MEPLGLSSYRLAKELHVSAPGVNDLLRGNRSITAGTAMRLGTCSGASTQLWLNLQNKRGLRVAAKNKSLSKVKPRAQAA